ncbi:MAG: nuclear transport factor 2 family protein [Cyclobacteriaceae bacterium]
MKPLVITIFGLSLLFTFSLYAQTSADKEAVSQTCMKYIEGFYEGDESKLRSALSEELNKFGFWKQENGNFGDAIHMSYQGAMDFAKNVRENEEYPPTDSPKIVEVMDLKEHIAAAKVTAWWGEDYLLLSKRSGNWKIEQVIWEGPLTK